MRNSASCDAPRTRRAFTLVELLVVIAIIGVLVALLLPAIQAARESARRTQCKNQLRQLALSFQHHHDALQYFPSGGWGYYWLGFPEQGFGKKQSGSWLYSVLPFMEQNGLHDLGKGATGSARRDACKTRVERPFEGMNCPSRRPTNISPFETGSEPYRYCTLPLVRGNKTDYAANGGDIRTTEIGEGPTPIGEDLLSVKPSTSVMESAEHDPVDNWNGIVFYCSEVNMRQVTDGTSKTYMVGEKWMLAENYDTGLDKGDNEPAFAGNDNDTIRVTTRDYPLVPDSQISIDAKNPGDARGAGRRIFGSAHPGGFNMAMCDASVDYVSLDIDPTVHAVRGGRDDSDELPPPPVIFR